MFYFRVAVFSSAIVFRFAPHYASGWGRESTVVRGQPGESAQSVKVLPKNMPLLKSYSLTDLAFLPEMLL